MAPRDEQLITVQVVRPGLYNGSDHRVLSPSAIGQLIQIPAGPYADSLIDDGLVVRPRDVADALDELAALGQEIDAGAAAQDEQVRLIPSQGPMARSKGKTR